jgi:hypothetical protein
MNRTARVALPEADTAFLRTFMPYEIRLAQRRAMLWERDPDALHSSVFLGVFVLRLDQPLGFTIPVAPRPRPRWPGTCAVSSSR